MAKRESSTKKTLKVVPLKVEKLRSKDDGNGIRGHEGETRGAGDELHQLAGGTHPPMTTQTGAIVADDENSLKAGERGPTLLEDHILLEKMQHFDHERIPERIVHARGFGAHGYFELTEARRAMSPRGNFQ